MRNRKDKGPDEWPIGQIRVGIVMADDNPLVQAKRDLQDASEFIRDVLDTVGLDQPAEDVSVDLAELSMQVVGNIRHLQDDHKKLQEFSRELLQENVDLKDEVQRLNRITT